MGKGKINRGTDVYFDLLASGMETQLIMNDRYSPLMTPLQLLSLPSLHDHGCGSSWESL